MNTNQAAIKISNTVHGNSDLARAIEQWLPEQIELETQLEDAYIPIVDLLPTLTEAWREHDAWFNVSNSQEYVCIQPLQEGQPLRSLFESQ